MSRVSDYISNWFSAWWQVLLGAAFGLTVGLFRGEASSDEYYMDRIETLEIKLDTTVDWLTEDGDVYILRDEFLRQMGYLRDEIEDIKEDYEFSKPTASDFESPYE